MICQMCSKDKPKSHFRYGYDKEKTSLLCKSCMDKLHFRLETLIEADKIICAKLGLDYWTVSNFEMEQRKRGIYREHLRK